MLRSSPNTKRNSFSTFQNLRSDSPPPLLPEYVPSSNPSHRKNYSRDFLPRNLKKKLRNYTRLVRSILALFLFLTIIYWLLDTVLILFKFKIVDGLTSSGWIGIGLKIRKPPLLFVQSSQSVAIVWESNKMASSSGHQLGLRYWMIGPGYKNQTISLSSKKERRLKASTGKIVDVRRTRPEGDNGWRRWIHTALLEDLQPGTTYGYDIVLLDSHPTTFQAVKKTYSKHRFTWYGIDPLDLNNGNRLSLTSPSSRNPIHIMNIIVIGDNQFGVKVFTNLVRRCMKMKSYLPKLNSPFGPRQVQHKKYVIPNKPSMIFHLGDAVQSPHNLKQWQTDFWDPLTHKNTLASEIPIVYAKGNHDFDRTGHNIYSGGLPKVQVGEMNETQTAKLGPYSPIEIPGIVEADTQYTTFKSHDRDLQSRSTYFAYSPHPRVRVIVCDSNLDITRMIHPESTLSEVDQHERWLLWEMARPEWKEASIRIILIHVPPFVEFWGKKKWLQGQESTWSQYVRTRFAPHFHALSPLTSRYDIPPASIVISGHSHVYARGMLSNSVANGYFSASTSSNIPMEVKEIAHLENKKEEDTKNSNGQDQLNNNGVIYVISGGAGGILDQERVEKWGFYQRTVIKKHHFNHILLDMSPTLSSQQEWNLDWIDSKERKSQFKDKKVKVYHLIGSQLVCKDKDKNHVWESGHYSAVDRLVWSTRSLDGHLLDRFVLEAASCR